MKVHELLEILEGLDENTEVRIATQPSWPLQFTVTDVVTSEELSDRIGADEYGYAGTSEPADTVQERRVWIVAGDHPYDDSPYASKALWDR